MSRAVGATLDATREPGESGLTGAGEGESSVWWGWMAPSNGLVRVVAAGADGLAVAPIRISRGATLETLAPVDPVEVALRRGMFFRAQAGESYELCVVSPTNTPAFFTLTLDYVPEEQAVLGRLTGNFGDLAGTTAGAAPVPELGDFSARSPTAYWDWIAPGAGALNVAQFVEQPGLRVTVYRQRADGAFDYAAGGSDFNAGSLDTESGVLYRLTFSTLEGEPGPFRGYFTWSQMRFTGPDPDVPVIGTVPITLAMTNVPAEVTFTKQLIYSTGYPPVTNEPPQLSFPWQPKTGGRPYVTCNLIDDAGRLWLGAWTYLRVRPLNDDFAQAENLTGETDFRRVSTTDATVEPGEPGTNGAFGTIWYRWVAPGSGSVGFQLARHQGTLLSNARLTVFRGADLAGLTTVGESLTGDRRQVQLSTEPGDTWWIRVVNVPDSFYPACLLVRLAPPVVNDNFAQRLPLTGVTATAEFEALFATKETGERGPYDGLASRTAWYSWTAPEAGEVVLDTSASDDATVKALAYVGPDWAALRRVTGLETESGDPRLRSFHFLVAGSTNYQVQVDSRAGTNITTGSPARMQLAFTAAPSNDEFTNRTVLSGERLVFTGTTRAARGEPLGPSVVRPAAQPGANGARAVWYEWTAPRTMRMTLAITGPDGAFGYPFRKAELAQMVALTPSATTTRTAIFSVTAGTSYVIAITSFDSALGLDFEAHLFPVEPPPNDNFADRTPLAGPHVVFEANHESSTGEPLDPAGRSIWWTWTAPVDGWATLLTPIDAQCFLWTGPALGNLKPVGTQRYAPPFSGPARSILTGFDVAQGTTYQISVRRPIGSSPAVYPITLDLTTWRLADPGAGATLPGAAAAELRYNSPLAGVDGILGAPGSLYLLGSTSAQPLVRNTNTPLAYLLPAAWTINPTLSVLAVATNEAGITRIARPANILFRPVNDDLMRAIFLGSEGPVGFSLAHATREPGEPMTPAGAAAGSVWWRWTAPYSGMVTWAATVTMPANLRLYSGSNFQTLKVLAEAQGDAPFVNASVTGGTTYFLNVTGPPEASGSLGSGGVIPIRLEGSEGFGLRFPDQREFPVELLADPAEVDRVELVRNGLPVFSSTQPPYRLELPLLPGATDDRISVAVWFHRTLTPYYTPEVTVAWRSSNDLFSRRTPLTGMTATDHAEFAHTDRETGEPVHGPPDFDHTLWWSWTAPADGVLEWTGQHGTWLAIYEGDTLESLQRIGSGPGGARSDVVGGRTYALVCAATVAIPSEDLSLQFARAGVPVFQGQVTGAYATLQTTFGRRSMDPPPPQVRTWRWTAPTNGVLGVSWNRALFTVEAMLNDLSQPVGAMIPPVASDDTLLPVGLQRLYPVVVSREFEVTFTAGEQIGPLDGALRCLTILTNRNFAEPPTFGGEEIWNAVTGAAARFPEDAVWFAWAAPGDGLVTLARSDGVQVSVVGGDAYPGLPILADTREALAPFPVVEGQIYRLAVNQMGPSTATGVVSLRFELNARPPVHPANDDWVAAIPLAGDRISFTGATKGATREQGEPLHAGVYGGRSVWWRWTAPASGIARLSSFPSPAAWHEIAVYRGERVDALASVGARALVGMAGDLVFPADAGVTYSIAMDAFHGEAVSSSLELSLTRPVPVRFLRLEHQAGSWLIQLEGPVGGAFELETSADLTHWHPVVTGTFLGGLGEVTLSVSPSEPLGFFRARSL